MFGNVSVTTEHLTDPAIASAMNISLLSSIYRIVFLQSSTHFFNGSCNNGAFYVSQQSAIEPLGGTFNLRMSADSERYAVVPYDIPAANLTAIIDTLLGYNNSVEVNENYTSSFKRAWLVTFSGDFSGGDVPVMSIDTTNLNGTFPQGQVSTVITGSEVTGNVSFFANDSINVLIDVRSNATTVATLFAALDPSIYDVSVNINGPTFSGGLEWIISYFSFVDVLISFNSSMLMGPNLISSITYLSSGSPPLTGYFSVSGNAQIGSQSVPIQLSLPFNVSTETFASELISQKVPVSVSQQVYLNFMMIQKYA